MGLGRTRSFSGADARVFVWYPDSPERMQELDSVQTLSVSIHESKSQARALGHRGIRGLARGVRTIAGSLILTVVNDNPLHTFRRLMSPEYRGPGWSLDRDMVGTGSPLNSFAFESRIAALLPPFSLLIQYINEDISSLEIVEQEGASVRYGIHAHPGAAAAMLLGVEFIDEGMVTSVNDTITEVTLSFIACDYKPLSRQDFDLNSPDLAADLRNLQVLDAGARDMSYTDRIMKGLNKVKTDPYATQGGGTKFHTLANNTLILPSDGD